MDLPETRNALFEILSDEESRVGLHLADHTAVGVPGVSIGEIPFNSSIHPVSAIDARSINETAFDRYYVRHVVPFKPIEMNVVLHRDPSDRRIPEWMKAARAYKQELASNVAKAVFDAKQFGDDINYYVLGDINGESVQGWNAELVSDTESPEEAAKAIADICLRGLTFIVSDFNNLPLESNSGISRSIAVKVNHGHELQVPPVKAIVRLGGIKEVNAGKKKELARFNEGLATAHSDIRARLGGVGLEVAQVALDVAQDDKFNVSAADEVISAAIRSVIAR